MVTMRKIRNRYNSPFIFNDRGATISRDRSHGRIHRDIESVVGMRRIVDTNMIVIQKAWKGIEQTKYHSSI